MKQCHICITPNKEIEWKDANLLRRFLSQDNKILRPRVTGTCAKHQREIARAIKRARTMGIIAYTPLAQK
ncbi:MAG: 30S ribosomal protein S18 [Candidatus Spechtbacterales bacterium]